MREISYKMPQAITFETVNSVLKQLKQTFSNDDYDAWLIDLHEVKQCDSAGLALLIEAKRVAAVKEKHLDIVGASKKLTALAKFCGVEVVLND